MDLLQHAMVQIFKVQIRLLNIIQSEHTQQKIGRWRGGAEGSIPIP